MFSVHDVQCPIQTTVVPWFHGDLTGCTTQSKWGPFGELFRVKNQQWKFVISEMRAMSLSWPLGRCDTVITDTNVWAQNIGRVTSSLWFPPVGDCFKSTKANYEVLITVKNTCGDRFDLWNDQSVGGYGNNLSGVAFSLDFRRVQCHMLERVTTTIDCIQWNYTSRSGVIFFIFFW